MAFQAIRFDVVDGAAWITLARPEVKNALNFRMRAEITQAIKLAESEARVLVITGDGDSFCSGQDLGHGQTMAQLDVERVLREEYEPMLRALFDCRIPTVSAVNGAAAGAGANLALSADVVIATESAVFLQAFTRIGLMPDAGGTYWLPRQVGFARAMGAALFAEPVTARQAEAWGMIWEAVPDEAFDSHVQARVGHLANGPTEAFRRTRQAIREGLGNSLEEQLALEARLQGECGATRDFAEGVTAFAEKRPPSFEGR